MTKYYHRWLNTDEFDSLYPNFTKRSTVAMSENDYDNISAPIVSNV